jgi:hypothetical protein
MKILLALIVLLPTVSFAEYDKEEVRGLIRENLPKFRQCYEDSPAFKAGTQGKLVFQISLSEKGTVKEAKLNASKSSFRDDKAESCIIQRLKTMPPFPAPAADEEIEFNYPFIFTIKPPAKPAEGEAAKPADKPTDKAAEKPAAH